MHFLGLFTLHYTYVMLHIFTARLRGAGERGRGCRRLPFSPRRGQAVPGALGEPGAGPSLRDKPLPGFVTAVRGGSDSDTRPKRPLCTHGHPES